VFDTFIKMIWISREGINMANDRELKGWDKKRVVDKKILRIDSAKQTQI